MSIVNPHEGVFSFNPNPNCLTSAIDKRLKQIEALTMMGMFCNEEDIFSDGTAKKCFSLLNDLINEVMFLDSHRGKNSFGAIG